MDRAEVESYLAGIERTLENMGVSPSEMPVWVSDQIRAMVASKLPSRDEAGVLAFFAGFFVCNSAACIYGGMTHSPHAQGYLASLVYTIKAVMPLFDLPARAVEPPSEFVDWDEMMSRLEELGQRDEGEEGFRGWRPG
jgi:hypothetical protein